MKSLLLKTLFVLYGLYIAYLSLRPTDNVLMSINHVDKVIHLLTYGLFAILGYFATQSAKNYPYVCFGIIFYGILIEIGQSFIPDRMMSGFDILANSLGVLLAAIVISKLLPKTATINNA